MRFLKTGLSVVLAGLLVSSFSSTSWSKGNYVKDGLGITEESKWFSGEILVKFKKGISEGAIRQINERHQTSILSVGRHEKVKRLRIPQNKTVEEMIAVYRQNSNVEYAEPNYLMQLLWIPNDPLYQHQWHFYNPRYGGIQMEGAWEISTGRTEVTVAVLDTGVAYEDYDIYRQAPDLANTNFIPGYDFINSDEHANDDHGHGTHVAGTIAQSTNNLLGVAGIAFDTTIMPVKVLNLDGIGRVSGVVDGIHYATDHGAQIINLSLGSPWPSSYLEEAVAYAYNQGVTIICAAGNAYPDERPFYPAAYDNYCIAVGATRYDETRSYYSNTGDYLDITAPGGDLSVDQNGDGYADGILQQTFNPETQDPTDFAFYWLFQGTSMAAAHVSGVAALLMANDVFAPDAIRAILEATAEDKGDEGWDEEYGWGIVDAQAALELSTPTVHDIAILAIDAPPEAYQGESIGISVTVENQGNILETTTVSLSDLTDGLPISSQIISLEDGASRIISFDWDTTSASIGSHCLLAEATLDEEDSDPIDNSITTMITIKKKITEPALHVSDIKIRLRPRVIFKFKPKWRCKCKHIKYHAVALVTIVDESGLPVKRALVKGNWSLNETHLNSRARFTHGKGKARLRSARVKAKSGDIFTFTVTDVAKRGYVYDPDSNSETSDSVTMP